MKNVKFASIYSLFVTLFFLQNTFAQNNVDSAELKNNLGSVEFIDNTGASSIFNTRAEIFNIGNSVGLSVNRGAAVSGDRSRYFVIHRLHPAEFDKLDGDIIGLGSGASVDTIRNLRSIIAGYLQGAYNYNATDAGLLSEYITIYNAVYRKNRTYFSSRYKTPLLNDLTTGMEGLALRWSEWPGQTLMIIPLQTAADGSLSAVDTTSITDAAVIAEMRKDDDRGVGSRRDMVDMKEREATEAAEKAVQQRAEADAAEKKIAAEKQQLESEKQRLEAEKVALKDDNSPEAQQRAAELAEKEKELNEKEESIEKEQEEADAKNAAAQSNEEFAERKIQEADADRDAISSDQKELIAAGTPPQTTPAATAGILGVRLPNKTATAGAPTLVNPSSAQVIKTSSLSSVKARTLVMVGGKTLAIAGTNGEKGAQRLIEIDPQSLTMIKSGEDDINVNSLIWINDSNLFAIVNSGGKSYLARFDVDLKLQVKSDLPIHGFASINFVADKILTQKEDGTVLILKADTLKE
ncbi:MAG: P83/100 family protein [Termitinemataceae bacterium]|nr:MAG: P83/100 family protein [Termitinemataceae bacterium]